MVGDDRVQRRALLGLRSHAKVGEDVADGIDVTLRLGEMTLERVAEIG